MVKGKGDAKIVEVPFRGSSLNKSDVFILIDDNIIYQWCPPGANVQELVKSDIIIKQINQQDFSGLAKIVRIGENVNLYTKFFKIKLYLVVLQISRTGTKMKIFGNTLQLDQMK